VCELMAAEGSGKNIGQIQNADVMQRLHEK